MKGTTVDSLDTKEVAQNGTQPEQATEERPSVHQVLEQQSQRAQGKLIQATATVKGMADALAEQEAEMHRQEGYLLAYQEMARLLAGGGDASE